MCRLPEKMTPSFIANGEEIGKGARNDRTKARWVFSTKEQSTTARQKSRASMTSSDSHLSILRSGDHAALHLLFHFVLLLFIERIPKLLKFAVRQLLNVT